MLKHFAYWRLILSDALDLMYGLLLALKSREAFDCEGLSERGLLHRKAVPCTGIFIEEPTILGLEKYRNDLLHILRLEIAPTLFDVRGGS